MQAYSSAPARIGKSKGGARQAKTYPSAKPRGLIYNAMGKRPRQKGKR